MNDFVYSNKERDFSISDIQLTSVKTACSGNSGIVSYPQMGYILESSLRQFLYYRRMQSTESTRVAIDNKLYKLRARVIGIAGLLMKGKAARTKLETLINGALSKVPWVSESMTNTLTELAKSILEESGVTMEKMVTWSQQRS